MPNQSRPLTRRSRSQLEAYIRLMAKDSANVAFTDHIRAQMRSRGISTAGVLSTLRGGRIKRTPEPNMFHGTLECRMEAAVAGEDIGVVVALSDDDPTLVLVTALYL